MESKKTTGEPTPALTGPSHGPQGVDKAPGEEESEDTLNFKEVTQKGKTNDGDPGEKADQPIDQSELPASNTSQ